MENLTGPIVVYSPKFSSGARELVAWLKDNGHPAIRYKNDRYLQQEPALVVAWGRRLPLAPDGVCQYLNARAPIGNKYVELAIMAKAGVPTPRSSTVKVDGWWARRHSHHSGNDLLASLPVGDYYVEPVATDAEARVHVFRDDAFRIGVKVPNHPEPHVQIRTQLGGWGLDYARHAVHSSKISRSAVREAAVAAVKALGYDFGAVDVGFSSHNGPVVFEVNSAPGLEGVTIRRYGERFLTYAQHKEETTS